MISPCTQRAVSKETPYTPPTTTTPPPVVQLAPPSSNTTALPQPNPPSPPSQKGASSPDSVDGSADDFLVDAFSDSDSDDDQRAPPRFDYDARFRPLEGLNLSEVRKPDREAELCYAVEDFGPENMKSWCLPDFVPPDVFAVVGGGDAVDFIEEFNEYFWLVWVHRTEKAGVIPVFNIEGQLEREARQNKEANEEQTRKTAFYKQALKDKNAHDEDLTFVSVEDEVNGQPRNQRSVSFKSVENAHVRRSGRGRNIRRNGLRGLGV